MPHYTIFLCKLGQGKVPTVGLSLYMVIYLLLSDIRHLSFSYYFAGRNNLAIFPDCLRNNLGEIFEHLDYIF